MSVIRTKRPVFLELWRIKLPLPGFVSILHRLSGVLMVLAIPVGAMLLHHALSGPQGFAASTVFLAHWPVRLILCFSCGACSITWLPASVICCSTSALASIADRRARAPGSPSPPVSSPRPWS